MKPSISVPRSTGVSLLLLLTVTLLSQAPQGFTYQAVAYQNNESQPILLAETVLDLEISILDGTTEVYRETHSPVTTDKLGRFAIVIGEGNPQGSSFGQIDWSTGNYYLSMRYKKSADSNFETPPAVKLQSVPYALFAESTSDGDTDASNELQDLSITGHTVTLSRGGGAVTIPDEVNDADADPGNELQALSIAGHTLSLSGGGGEVTIPDNVNDADADPANEIQNLSITGNELSISNGNSIFIPTGGTDADADPYNEIQDLRLTGNILTITKNGSATQIDLSPYLDDTDTKLTESEVDAFVANNGYLTSEVDGSVTNELQNLTLSGSSLGISGGSGVTLPDGSSTNEIQTLSISGETISLSRGGGSVVLPFDDVNDADADPVNEIQDLQINNDVLTITKNASATPIDLGALITSNAGWETNEGNVVYLNGNVGVGTITPEGRLSVRGIDETVDEPLFMVSRKDGYPVFAVYEDGVYAFTDTVDSGKGVKGGFAVGGYRNTSKGIGEEYMRVTADSIRFYIDEDGTTKGVKGGFAVGGYRNTSKGLTGNDYLRVSPDSVRIYIDEDPLAKGVKGGFAVGGYRNTAKATGNEYLRVTTDSTRIFADDTDAGFGIAIHDANGFVEMDYNSFLISSQGVRKIWLLDSIGYPGWIATKGPGDSFNAVIGYVTGYPDFGSIAVLNDGSNFRAGMQVNSNGTGVLYGEGPNDYTNFVATYLYGYPNNGYASVNDQYGGWQARMYVNASGQGVIDADIKNFRMPLPDRPGYDIVYTCVEGPEAAAYVRGTAELSNGTAEITFPDHFQIVASETGMTILTTPLSADSKGLAVVEKNRNGFTVKELFNGTGTYSFDWEAKCIRKGYEGYKVIQESIDNQTEESKSLNSGGLNHDFIAPGNM